MTDAVAGASRITGARSPWLIAAIVVVPTFMEVLDTTIAIVALRYIAGGLSATVDRQRMGHHQLPRRQRHHPADLRLVFGAHWAGAITSFCRSPCSRCSSALCGVATSLDQLILFRVLQGLAGGGLQPSSQGVLLDASRRKNRARPRPSSARRAARAGRRTDAGRLITDNYSWRWIFYHQRPGGHRWRLPLYVCSTILTIS